MSIYDDLPTLNLSLFPPGRMIVNKPDDGLEGGRNGDEEPQAISFSGGGRLNVTYVVEYNSREQHDYLNLIEARLSGSFRYINVPIMTDWIGPFPENGRGIPQITATRLFDPDGSLIGGSTAIEHTVTATVAENAALHAGIVKITLNADAAAIGHSVWWSVSHADKGHRAYRSWDKLSVVGQTYELAIDRPLRQAVTAGQVVRIVRPVCAMRYPSRFTAGWEVEGFWKGRATLQFVEAP